MLSETKEEKDTDSDGGEGILIEDGKRKKKVHFDVDGVPFHYTREVGIMMSRKRSCNAHNVSISEEAVYFSRKGSPYGDVISHMDIEGNEKDPQGLRDEQM